MELADAVSQLGASQGHFAYLAASPLTATLGLLADVIGFAFIAGTATAWWSWVDRIWSLSPAAFVVLYAALAPPSPRLLVMAALSSLWAARLTYNFWRKGGFGEVKPSEEDYRWPWVRAWMARSLPPQLLPLQPRPYPHPAPSQALRSRQPPRPSAAPCSRQRALRPRQPCRCPPTKCPCGCWTGQKTH